MIQHCPDDIKTRLLEYLSERFGFDTSVLDSYEIYMSESSRQKIFLGPKMAFPVRKCDTGGVLIARAGRTIKPGTSLFQLFGEHIKKNIARLTKDQVAAFVAGSDLELQPEQIDNAERGFVMVSWENRPLGCGLLKDNRLENQIPKANRIELKEP